MPRVVAAFLCVVVCVVSSATAVSAQGIGNLAISGNQVTASLDLPGISADLTLNFEQAIGSPPATSASPRS